MRVALGPSRDVVMIDGAVQVRPIGDLDDETVGAYQSRHGSDPRGWATAVLVVTPQRIQA